MILRTHKHQLTFTLLILILFTCGVLSSAAPPLAFAQAESKKLNILFVSSFTKNLPAQVAFESGLDKALGCNKGRHNLFFEFMDIPRLSEDNFKGIFPKSLEGKYHGVKFDFLVGWASEAIRFLIDNGGLFAEANRIYVEPPPPLDVGRNLTGKETLFGVKANFEASLQETFKLEHPKHIVVIGTTKDLNAQTRLNRFKTLLSDIKLEIEVEYLLDQTITQVASKLANLPRKDTIAFYLLMFSDGQGHIMSPYAVVSHLASRSAVPIYSFWESLMGSGIVGGYLLSQEMIGINLGKTILSIQKGEKVIEFSPMRHVYDWNAIKKWNINKSKIPDDAIILNRPPDILAHYRWHIIAGVSLCFIEALLIFFLFINRKKRLKVEHELREHRDHLEELVDERTVAIERAHEELKDSEKKFHYLSDAAFEGIVFTEKGKIIEINNTCCEMFGYRPSEVIDKVAVDFISPEGREDVKNKVLSGYNLPYETRGVRKDGSTFPIEIHAKMFSYKGRDVRVSAIRDLTEKKKTEEEIKILRGILPLCSFCKKIRNDKGYWEMVEVYIHKHSQADISHSVCPDCMKKHYPEENEDIYPTEG